MSLERQQVVVVGWQDRGGEHKVNPRDIDIPTVGDVIERSGTLVQVVQVRIDTVPGGRELYIEWRAISDAPLVRALAEFLVFADVQNHRTYETRIPRELLAATWLRSEAGREWLSEWLSARPESPVPDSHSGSDVGRGGRI